MVFSEGGGVCFEVSALVVEGYELGSGGLGLEGDFLECGVIDCRGEVGEADARDEEEDGH